MSSEEVHRILFVLVFSRPALFVVVEQLQQRVINIKLTQYCHIPVSVLFVTIQWFLIGFLLSQRFAVIPREVSLPQGCHSKSGL